MFWDRTYAGRTRHGAGVKLDGARELVAALKQVDEKVRNRVIRGAVRKAAKPMRARAEQLAPEATGLLRLSMAIRTKLYRRTGVAVAVVGARAEATNKEAKALRAWIGRRVNPANYAHLVEFGTAPHAIKRPGGGGPKIRHPGARPQPFMLPAYTATWRRMFRDLAAFTWAGLEKEARKARKARAA